jgi:hypothetical protein
VDENTKKGNEEGNKHLSSRIIKKQDKLKKNKE